MFGGAGDDVLYGGPGVQWISGGLSPNDLRLNGGNPDKGNDRLFGGCEQQCADAGDLIEGSDGNDGLDGGPGNDEFRGGPGTDTYVGGIGNRDMVTYAEHVVPVNASLNGVADDGARGELENLPNDVEDLYGGWSNDTLIGNASDNTLDGGPSGSDTLIGMNGVDWLYGGPGGDELYGDFNNANRLGMDDYLYGGPGYDLLVGEWGYDHAREHEYDEGYDTCQSTEFVDYDDCERILPWP
jgi:Ca2+-binding RTX toxin-like protein